MKTTIKRVIGLLLVLSPIITALVAAWITMGIGIPVLIVGLCIFFYGLVSLGIRMIE